jgi:dienelactone hydrolase
MRHRWLTLPRDGRADVSGVLWEPIEDEGPAPLVLLGHGGGTHKNGERCVRLAQSLVSEHGVRVLAIDGPFHGDRPPPPGLDHQQATVAEGVRAVMDRMVTDWLDVLAVVRADRSVTRLGYLGLSMGARYGLGVAAALGDALHGAVLGKYGLEHTGVLDPGLDDKGLTLSLAARVRCPVLFHLEEQDQIFAADSARALYDALGASDRSLRTGDGDHASARPEDEAAWIAFLAARLDP